MRMHTRGLYVSGLTAVLGGVACAQILGIDDAQPGWMPGSGGSASSASSASSAATSSASASATSSSTSAGTGGTGGSGADAGGDAGDAGAPQCLPGTTMGCQLWAELFGGLQD